MVVTARAHPNIALIKYWGKRDVPLNLPVVGSISITLGGLETVTRVSPAKAGEDHFSLNGEAASPKEARRLKAFVDILRARSGRTDALHIESRNTFPTAAGLASSASGFAALALGVSRYLELTLTLQGLSEVARRGSGSAARSLHGGFVEWRKGEATDGSDSIAVPLADASWWDLRVLVCVLARGRKDIGSREGMALTAKTSPMYQTWIDAQEPDLEAARGALQRRDFQALGEVAEASCMKMVSTWLTTRPALHYWRPETLGVIQAVTALRGEGLPLFFTTDAGPHVKVICPGEAYMEVEARLRALPGVLEVLHCPVGGPARVEVQGD